MSTGCRAFKLALVQMAVGSDKSRNICRAADLVRQVVTASTNNDRSDSHFSNRMVVCLPECFNSPYGTQHFATYAERVPGGETSAALATMARNHGIYLVAGSMPERDDNHLLYNTCTVWSPTGDMVAKYRKMHLFDIDIPDRITFSESSVLTAGSDVVTFDTAWGARIGLGICYDIRFAELAHLYARRHGCHVLLYPGAFNMTTGPAHWALLARARAVDNQLYVACASPARTDGQYVAYGHSLIVDPWGQVIAGGDAHVEMTMAADVDLDRVDAVRQQIPIGRQRRHDVYNAIV